MRRFRDHDSRKTVDSRETLFQPFFYNFFMTTEQEAKDYLEKHRILPLFEKLCSELVLSKPENPRAFLLDLLHSLPSDPSLVGLSLFGDRDIDAMFSMLDPVGKGTISGTQVNKALTSMGFPEIRLQDIDAQISKEKFKTIVGPLVKI